MGMGMYFVAVSKKQLKEILEDNDVYYEITDEAEDDDVAGLDWEFDAVNFLINNWFDENDYGEEFDNTVSLDYLDEAHLLDDISEFYLDVDDVKLMAEKFKKFSVDEFRRRFNSTEFKVKLESKDDEVKIYHGKQFGDESYFETLLGSFQGLSEYFINAAKKKRAILFYYV